MILSRLCSVLLLAASVAFAAGAAADASKLPKSITLSYEYIGASSVQPLVTVFYDPKTLQSSLSSWTPPTVDPSATTTPDNMSSKLVRILLPDGSSSVATIDTFNTDFFQKIHLWLSPDDGSVFSASVTSLSPPPLTPEEDRYKKKVERAKAKGKPIPPPPPVTKTKKAREEAEKAAARLQPVQINLITSQPGPVPNLSTRPPPKVDAQGREIEAAPQEEKSFFQKYWWVFLALVMLTIGSGGGGDSK